MQILGPDVVKLATNMTRKSNCLSRRSGYHVGLAIQGSLVQSSTSKVFLCGLITEGQYLAQTIEKLKHQISCNA